MSAVSPEGRDQNHKYKVPNGGSCNAEAYGGGRDPLQVYTMWVHVPEEGADISPYRELHQTYYSCREAKGDRPFPIPG